MAVVGAGSLLEMRALGSGAYRIYMSTGSCTAANTHTVFASLQDTATSIRIGGVQVEDMALPTSIIPTTTTTVTRNADALTFPFAAVPQAMTVYVKMHEIGAAATANGGVLAIGDVTDAALFVNGTGSAYKATHRRGGDVSSTAGGAPARGDLVELRVGLASTGSVFIAQTLNSATEAVAATSSANALAGSWHATTVRLGSLQAGSLYGQVAIASVRIVVAVQTLATMQGVVYDSGWITPIPAGFTAEDIVGVNLAAMAIVPSTFTTARYWSAQVDDTGNSAGYVDLARLMVCGGYIPTYNMIVGAKSQLVTDSQRISNDFGGAFYLDKPRLRTDVFSIANLPTSESFLTVRKMQRQLGITGQFFWVFDNTATGALLAEQSYAATMKEIGALDFPNVLPANTIAFSVIEDI